MTTFLEKLQAAAAAPQAQLNRFLTSFRPTGRDLWFFVEGKDDLPFYGLHARGQLPGVRVEFIRCDNKDGVINALEWFLGRFKPNKRAAFFVDADFDDLIDNERNSKIRSYPFGFVTDGYSVENYICSGEIVRNWFAEALSLAGQPQACIEAQLEFEAHLASFQEAIRPSMSWMLAIRRAGKRANFNNVDSQRLVVEAQAGNAPWLQPSLPELREYLRGATGVTHDAEPTDDHIAAEISLTQTMPASKWLRGKQAIWLIITFLNKASAHCKEAGLPTRARPALSAKKNAIEGLLPYASPPESLVAFFNSIRIQADSP